MRKVTFIHLISLFFLLEKLPLGNTGDVTYVLDITDEILSCPDFENNKYQADSITLGLVSGKDDKDGRLGLSGPVEMKAEVDDEQELSLLVSRETELGQEHVFMVEGNICKNLKQKDAPWDVLVTAMNLTGCPIGAGSYTLKDVVMNMGSMDQLMTREYCGAYQVTMKIETPTEVMSCHIMQMEIYERNA